MSLNTHTDPSTKPQHQPQENLRAYVVSAQIPKPKFHRGHPLISRGQDRVIPQDSFLLPIYPDRRFLLREMRVFEPDVMERKVKAFIREAVPSEPIMTDIERHACPVSSTDFYLPAPGFVASVEPLQLVQNAIGLAETTLQVLRTAERVVNLVWAAADQRHAFISKTPLPPLAEGDTPICLPLFYAKLRETNQADIYKARMKMAVIVMTPWALSRADMYDMITLSKLPSLEADGSWPRWNRAHKVWAQVGLTASYAIKELTLHKLQIEDYCVTNRCKFFVLTTYEHWIFGSFHPESFSLLVSTHIVSYTDSRPSVLEWLIFWCASALQVPGSWNPMVSYNNPVIGNLKDFYPSISLYD